MKNLKTFLILCNLLIINSFLSSQELVAHWGFDTLINNRFIDHVSGEFAGTVYGADVVSGPVGNALSFDGLFDYVRVPGDNQAPPINITKLSQGSISLWFKVYDIPTTNGIRPIFYYGREDACNFFDAANEGLIIEVGHSPIHNSSKRLYFTTWKNGCTFPTFCYDSWNPISEGVWYHYVAVVGADYNTGYLNGMVMTDRKYNFGNPFSHEFFADARKHENLWIGRGYWDTNDMYFRGVIDEIKIYDAPLSPAQVNSLYHEGVPVSVTNVSAIDKKLQIDVYPNPAGDEISLDLKNYSGKGLSFNIYNTSGFLVQQIEITGKNNSLKIDISELPEGLYFYSLQENSRIISTNKLVKL